MAAVLPKPAGAVGGDTVDEYTLRARDGLSVSILTYGARISAMHLSDGGPEQSLVYGFHTLEEYEWDQRYHGATIGRFANRIRGGEFVLGGATYRLSGNEGSTALHGGRVGFDRAVWHTVKSRHRDGTGELVLELDSAHGDQGFPGNLLVRAHFFVGPENVLEIRYSAISSAPTPVALTNHSYFNLSGWHNRDVYGHQLQVNASTHLVLDGDKVPTGEVASVDGTRYDLRTMQPLQNFDNYWVLDRDRDVAVELYDPASRRSLQVSTTEPGVQIYSGFAPAIAIEPQQYPDAPNHPQFPSTVVAPGRPYASRTIYRFSRG